MQTFLPRPSFVASAKALDMKRLGKQRVECLQLLKTFVDPDAGWRNHPARTMWVNHEGWLALYGLKVCDEWISRGYNDTCRGKILTLASQLPSPFLVQAKPPWLGDHAFHISHQSNLVRKDPDFYGPQFPEIKGTMEYVWPSLSHFWLVRAQCQNCGYSITRQVANSKSHPQNSYGRWYHSLTITRACSKGDGIAEPKIVRLRSR